MKINKYYAALAVLLAIVLITAFTQRSNWDADKFILSADDSGNLRPISEKYFADKEKALLVSVDTKLAVVNERIADVDNKVDDKEKSILTNVATKIAAVNKRITDLDNKVNVQRGDFNNRNSHVDRHFATNVRVDDIQRLANTVSTGLDALKGWADGRYQPKGNYVNYNTDFNLQIRNPGDPPPYPWKGTRWFIS